MTTYRIANWETKYENNRSRELKEAAWFPCPNVFDGDGYCTMIEGPDGPIAYCGWILLVGVASRCQPRGTLIQTTGHPHTPTSIAFKTRVPVTVIDLAINRGLHTKWLEEVPHASATSSHPPATEVRPLPREEERKGNTPSPPPLSTNTTARENPPKDGGDGGGVIELTVSQVALYRTILAKPAWMGQDDAWIDAVTARTLACLPTTTPALIAHAVKEARAKRKTLTNPAGLVVKRLRNPDPGVLQSISAQESAK